MDSKWILFLINYLSIYHSLPTCYVSMAMEFIGYCNVSIEKLNQVVDDDVKSNNKSQLGVKWARLPE